MNTARIFARFKARQSRGSAWMQIIMNTGIITANAALFKDYFEKIGIPLCVLILLGVMGYMCLTISIGYIDEKSKIWSYESEYNSNINPVMIDIQHKIDKILKNNGGIKND